MIQASLHRSAPTGKSEIGATVLKMVQSLSRISNSDFLLVEETAGTVIDLVKTLTLASWVEFLIVEEGALKITTTITGEQREVRQRMLSLPMTHDSLPGYVALRKSPETISNPSSSTFYSSFKYKLSAFRGNSLEPDEGIRSIACVPLLDAKQQVFAVVHMFNKTEHNVFCTFTEDDICLVQAIGEALKGVLATQGRLAEYNKKLSKLQTMNAQAAKVTATTLKLLRQHKFIKYISFVLGKTGALTQSVLKAMTDVMDSDAALVHLAEGKTLNPTLSHGIRLNCPKAKELSNLSTLTSQYIAQNQGSTLNIKDLQNEPHFVNDIFKSWDREFACSLSIPLLNGDRFIGVLEFFREEKEYNSLEEERAEGLAGLLSKIEGEKVQMVLPLSEGIQSNSLYNRYSRFLHKSLYEFHLRPEIEGMDYTLLLKECRTSLRLAVKSETCNVYLTNEGYLWTWVSPNCQPLQVPKISSSLVGYAAVNRSTIAEVFPTGKPDLDQIPEAKLMYGDAVLLVPVKGSVCKDQILGVIILTRRETAYTDKERDDVQLFAEALAMQLEALFFRVQQFSEEAVSEEDLITSPDKTSDEAKFRTINVQAPGRSRKSRRTRTIGPVRHDSELSEESADLSGESRTQDSFVDLKQFQVLRGLAEISPKRWAEVKGVVKRLLMGSSDILMSLYGDLKNIIPCQATRVLLLDENRQTIRDLRMQSYFQPMGVLNTLLLTGNSFLANSGLAEMPDFQVLTHAMGISLTVENILIVPIFHIDQEPIGAVCFVNHPVSFSPEDQAVAGLIALIPREHILGTDDTLKKWKTMLQAGRRQKLLLEWCKRIFTVVGVAQHKSNLVRDIAFKVTSAPDFITLITAVIDILCARINVEGARITFGHGDGEFSVFTRDRESFFSSGSPKFREIEARLKEVESGKVAILEKQFNLKNIILAPMLLEGGLRGVVEAWNKKDETLARFAHFSKDDEATVAYFAAELREPLIRWVECHELHLTFLQQFIRETAASINTYPMISTIRSAAQALLDCDRGTVFTREGNSMTVKAQGYEQEIPVGFAVPIGKGIIGTVAQTGQAINIRDAYQDSRFNTDVDKRTGYHTTSMLCMPVLNPSHEVIAALQMINKRRGEFDEDDSAILEVLCEIISTALDSHNRFQDIIEERTRLLNILGSTGNWICVLNKSGQLDYCNQRLDVMFGVPEDTARGRHYTYWLQPYRSLVKDLNSVFETPSKRIERFNVRFETESSGGKYSKSAEMESAPFSIVHYWVYSMQDFASKESIGVVLLVEDQTQLEAMKKEVTQMQSKITELTKDSPVNVTNGLQRCIELLKNVQMELEPMDLQAKGLIKEIIRLLKSGNLNQTNVQFNNDEVGEELKMYIGKNFVSQPDMEFGRAEGMDKDDYIEAKSPSVLSRALHVYQLEEVAVADLRTWDLNVWEITNHFSYIVSMLKDFDLVARFELNLDLLSNFVNEMQRLYNHRGNPFHNFYHGFSVMHSIYVLLSTTNAAALFQAPEMLALLVGGLCHDVDHTGRTNSFEVSKSSTLAIMYHDVSVLEQHHAAVAFMAMQDERCNIFQSITAPVRKEIRKFMITCILATDMSKHFGMISTLKSRLADEDAVGTRPNDTVSFAELLIHCADLAHPTKGFHLCLQWSLLVRKEFTAQVAEEKQLGLPVTTFLDGLEDQKTYFKNEISFVSFVVKPIWECICTWLHPSLDGLMNNLQTNVKMYQENLDSLLESA
jgi:GAF domain-containing protein